jgi:hypothetical protein
VIACFSNRVLSRNKGEDGSSGLTMIVIQHSSESTAPSAWVVNFAGVSGPKQSVSKPLMVSLPVIVGHILLDRVPKRCRSEEDQPTQTLFLDRTYKSLGESVQIGRARRQGSGASRGIG